MNKQGEFFMAAYQNYLNSGYNAYTPYGQRPFYGNYQQPIQSMQTAQPQIQQPMVQQPVAPQQSNSAPINDIRFVTSDEAKAFMVLPYQNALLIDTQNKVAWLKMADGIGQSTTRLFKYAETEQNQPSIAQNAQSQIDLSGFAKKEDLGAFATKQDMQAVVQALDNLQRRLQINQIEMDGKGNGTGNTKS